MTDAEWNSDDPLASFRAAVDGMLVRLDELLPSSPLPGEPDAPREALPASGGPAREGLPPRLPARSPVRLPVRSPVRLPVIDIDLSDL